MGLGKAGGSQTPVIIPVKGEQILYNQLAPRNAQFTTFFFSFFSAALYPTDAHSSPNVL